MIRSVVRISVLGSVIFGVTLLPAQEVRVIERHSASAAAAAGVSDMAGMTGLAMAPQGATYQFIGAHAGMEGKVVKNSPYSAEGVTESVKVLADGTKITQKHISKMFRDTEGRTRREIEMGGIGPLATGGEGITMVTINDPVAGRVYTMRKGDKTAQRIELLHPNWNVQTKELKEGEHNIKIIRREFHDSEKHEGGDHDVSADVWLEKEGSGGLHVIGEHDFSAAEPGLHSFDSDSADKEDLGDRVIEGVVSKGTRTTRTIPEGEIGNDRPIEIVSERWYSDELQAVVMTRTNNPMSGVVTYKLTNINRTEPDGGLFEIPADIKVVDGPAIQRRIHIEHTVEREKN